MTYPSPLSHEGHTKETIADHGTSFRGKTETLPKPSPLSIGAATLPNVLVLVT